MSKNKTANLNLHSWVETDPILMSEFNENFASLDAFPPQIRAELADAKNELSGKIDSTYCSLNEKISTVSTNLTNAKAASVKVVTGTYTGDGTITKTLYFSGTPKYIVVRADGWCGIFYTLWAISSHSKSIIYFNPTATDTVNLEWGTNHLTWTNIESGTTAATNALNGSGSTYHYVAFYI